MVHSVWVTIYKMVKTGFKLSFTVIIILRTDARMCHRANTNLSYIMIFYRRGKIWRPPIGDKIKVYINMRPYTEHLQHSRLPVVLYRCVNARKKNVTLLPTYRSYVSLALTDRHGVLAVRDHIYVIPSFTETKKDNIMCLHLFPNETESVHVTTEIKKACMTTSYLNCLPEYI